METKHTVIGRREVPLTETHVGVCTGKVVEEKLNHGGEKAVFVKLSTGYMAWGFGPTWEAAEGAAVLAAKAL